MIGLAGTEAATASLLLTFEGAATALIAWLFSGKATACAWCSGWHAW